MKEAEISQWSQAVTEKSAPDFPVEAEQKCEACQLNWKQLLISPLFLLPRRMNGLLFWMELCVVTHSFIWISMSM